MSIERAKAYVEKWAPFFGLVEYHLHYYPVDIFPLSGPEDKTPFAASYYDMESMFGTLWVPTDEVWPDDTLELLVLHELAHFLVWDADEEIPPARLEAFCDRVARLAKGDFATAWPEEVRAIREGMSYRHYQEDGPSTKLDRRKWLPVVTDGLPERERDVITMLYWEGLSLREAGERLGLNYETVRRVRDLALGRMARYFDILEGGRSGTEAH